MAPPPTDPRQQLDLAAETLDADVIDPRSWTPEQRGAVQVASRIGAAAMRRETDQVTAAARRAGLGGQDFGRCRVGQVRTLIRRRSRVRGRAPRLTTNARRPGSRRGGSGSRTSSTDPGDDDGDPEPPGVDLPPARRRIAGRAAV